MAGDIQRNCARLLGVMTHVEGVLENPSFEEPSVLASAVRAIWLAQKEVLAMISVIADEVERL